MLHPANSELIHGPEVQRMPTCTQLSCKRNHLGKFMYICRHNKIVHVCTKLKCIDSQVFLPKRHFFWHFRDFQWQEILLWVFHSNIWAFWCIFHAQLCGSLWSGYHWKDLFHLQTLNLYIWCQFWSKVMTSEVEQRPRLVAGSYRQHGSQLCLTYPDSTPWALIP